MKKFIISLLKFYQRWLSPDEGLPRAIIPGYVRFCRFQPTCSHYMMQAIDKYGVVKGGWKGVLRLVRCNPFTAGGEDPLK